MRSSLIAFCCLFSVTLFAQNPGVTVQIDVFNPPQETVFATVDFIGSSEAESFSIALNENIFSTYYFELQNSWVQGHVYIEDCNGDTLTDSFINNDTAELYYASVFYCQSDSIFGCTDPAALNFDSFANVDDGSCIYNGPENDLCSGAVTLFPGSTIIDNTFATENEGIVGDCWNFGSGEGEQSSLWFSFTTPTEPAQISIEAVSNETWTLTDTQFGLFAECGGEMIYCDGNSGEGLLSAFEFSCGELDTNTTYILMVDGWNGDIGTCILNYEITSPCGTEVLGCTDPEASNYNPEATIDDGSCSYDECTEVFLGFDFFGGAPTDSLFMQWQILNDQGQVVEDGYFDNPAPQYVFCLEDGCYSLVVSNIDPIWDGIYSISISNDEQYFGEFNGDSEIFITEFGVNNQNCGDPIEGCTDPTALNYNPSAAIDDGSCEYFECENNEVLVLINTENWGYEISWNIRNEAGDEVAGSGEYPNYSTITELACLEDGCYTFEMFDSYGDGWNGGSFTILLGDTALASGTLEDEEFGSISFGVNAEGCVEEDVFGCTDPSAVNFNPDATIDDGSCTYECTDVGVGFDFTAGAPNSDNFMDWTLYDESLQTPIDTGEFNSWADFVGFCLEDGCYSFVIGNIPAEWEGIYNVFAGNEFVSFGEFSGDTSSIEFTFGVNTDGCGEIEEVPGCVDPEALNYNPEATIDDGSCEYSCTDISLGFDFDTYPNDSSYVNMYWTITNQENGEIQSQSWYNWAPQYELCLDTACYTFEMFNVPPEWNGYYFIYSDNESIAQGEFSGEESTFSINFGIQAEGCAQVDDVYGCTDPEAINYNPEATLDDGTCEYDFECGISFEVIADTLEANVFYIIPSENIVNASSVIWDFGDGSTSSEFYPTHIYESDGPFTLCLFVTFEDGNGNFCEISYCEILDGSVFGSGFLSGGFMINVIQPGTLGDKESLVEKELLVYPNPTNDITTISFTSDQSDKLTLRVMDLTGKVLEQQILSSSMAQQKIQVDLSAFPQGVYLIGLEQNGSRSYAKVVRR